MGGHIQVGAENVKRSQNKFENEPKKLLFQQKVTETCSKHV